MAHITVKHVAGAVAVAGVAGVIGRWGHGALGHLREHHNELFVGSGSVWYDRLSPRLVGKLYQQVAEQVIATHREGVVLDVGCGPGHLTLNIARLAPGLDVRGVDVSADMISRAIHNAERDGLTERLRFDVSEPTRLPYADASVDLIVTTLSMHHWTDVPTMLRELARVVRPGGQVWIYDVRQPEMDADALAAAVADGAFSAPRVEPMPLWVGVIPLRNFVRCTLDRR